MSDMPRREFVRSALAGGAALMLPGALPGVATFGRRGRSALADSHIEVLLGEPIGTIAPEVYGHFTEHLGGVIYDGVWVGEDSKVPNIGGIRKALVDALKRIQPSVIRWPGGCFADSYDWRDGVGPREQRPTRTNFWIDDPGFKNIDGGPALYDPNAFGTSEFEHFCRLVGAQPYLAVNVRTLPAQAFLEWLEYCNAPAGKTTWSDVRADIGDRDPYDVRFWGVGNESWGCGGNFTPEEYVEEFRRFTTWSVPHYGLDLSFIAAGPSGADTEWSRRMFNALRERNAIDSVWGLSVHHYSSAPGIGNHAVDYDETGWYDLLQSANRMEGVITSNWAAIGPIDRRHHVKLVIDEWGAWHDNAPLEDPHHLFESQQTIRDALVTSLTLDIFHRHADKVGMANVAQLINCIHSLFLSHEDKFTVTPPYHVFAMYAAHQGGQSVRTLVSAPEVSWTNRDGRVQELWGLSGSASVKDGELTLTVTNSSLAEPRQTEIAIRGGTLKSVRSTTLIADSMHDVNDFDDPERVKPKSADVPVGGQPLVYDFPPASVTKLAITLGA